MAGVFGGKTTAYLIYVVFLSAKFVINFAQLRHVRDVHLLPASKGVLNDIKFFQIGLNLFEKVACPQKRYSLRIISLNFFYVI